MSESTSKSNSKGSWSEALEVYRSDWMREFGLEWFTFDTPDAERTEDSQPRNKDVGNARVSFRSMLTLLHRRRLEERVTKNSNGEPKTGTFVFAPADEEERQHGDELLGNLMYFFMTGNKDYFNEIFRLWDKCFGKSRKNGFPGKGGDIKNELSMKAALFQCAKALVEENGIDPSREEVLERLWSTTAHRPSDTSKLFREAKLAFLKAKRGRPRKNRN